MYEVAHDTQLLETQYASHISTHAVRKPKSVKSYQRSTQDLGAPRPHTACRIENQAWEPSRDMVPEAAKEADLYDPGAADT